MKKLPTVIREMYDRRKEESMVLAEEFLVESDDHLEAAQHHNDKFIEHARKANQWRVERDKHREKNNPDKASAASEIVNNHEGIANMHKGIANYHETLSHLKKSYNNK